MTIKITAAKYEGDHKVWLAFQDGLEGVADFSSEHWSGVMREPLKYEQFFRYFAIGEMGELVWMNGFDMCPDYLHQKVMSGVDQ